MSLVVQSSNLNLVDMNSVSILKLTVSWILSTIALLTVAAVFHALIQADPTFEVASTISSKLTIPFTIVLFASVNLLVHSLFYFGGFSCAPIKKGMGLSLAIGLVYLLSILLFSSIITVHAPWNVIGLNLVAIVTEMSVLGLVVSIIGVSEIHRWGIFRWV